MHKLKNQIIFAMDLFFFVVLGCILIFFFCFAEDLYIRGHSKILSDAFTQFQEIDLSHIQSVDDEFFLPLENGNFSTLVTDENFQEIYSSNLRNVDSLIEEHIKGQKSCFSTVPHITHSKEKTGFPLSLCGRITQNGQDFYIYLSENTRLMHYSISIAGRYLLIVLGIFIVLGTVFSCFLAGKIVRPVQKIQDVANRLSKNDFSVRLPEDSSTVELAQLSADLNHMADRVQQNLNDLNNYNYLLLNQNRNMAEYEDIRKKLVSNITHELKTPLAIISSQVELLQYEYEETKKDYYFASIMEEIDKMSQLISSILQNSRLENQIQRAELSFCNLSDLLTELLPKYENWLSSLKICFTSSIQEDCGAYIDRLQIEQAVNNYMMNACRHTKPGKKIHLLLRSEEDFYYISVYNDGTRLPEAELSKIWTGFYQTGKQPADKRDTIGLGLYIVKDILNHHNGSCGVVNREHGPEFWMRIPKS